jgi:hypothetical protein
VADQPVDRATRQKVTAEIDRAHQMMFKIVPPAEFSKLVAAIEDSTNVDQEPSVGRGLPR